MNTILATVQGFKQTNLQKFKCQKGWGEGRDMFKLQIDWPTKDMLELLLTLYLRKKIKIKKTMNLISSNTNYYHKHSPQKRVNKIYL